MNNVIFFFRIIFPILLTHIDKYLPARFQKRPAIHRLCFGHENARFRENMPKTLVFKSIRTQRRRFQLVLDEIRLVGSFQILELRRG